MISHLAHKIKDSIFWGNFVVYPIHRVLCLLGRHSWRPCYFQYHLDDNILSLTCDYCRAEAQVDALEFIEQAARRGVSYNFKQSSHPKPPRLRMTKDEGLFRALFVACKSYFRALVEHPRIALWLAKEDYAWMRGRKWSPEAMEWAGQSMDHAFRYWQGLIPASEIPPEVLDPEELDRTTPTP